MNVIESEALLLVSIEGSFYLFLRRTRILFHYWYQHHYRSTYPTQNINRLLKSKSINWSWIDITKISWYTVLISKETWQIFVLIIQSLNHEKSCSVHFKFECFVCITINSTCVRLSFQIV